MWEKKFAFLVYGGRFLWGTTGTTAQRRRMKWARDRGHWVVGLNSGEEG